MNIVREIGGTLPAVIPKPTVNSRANSKEASFSETMGAQLGHCRGFSKERLAARIDEVAIRHERLISLRT
jgi:hypothetical protein